LKPLVYFRADGNSKLGLGHVVRLLALADMIRNDFDCQFIIQNPSPEIKEQILKVCSQVIELPELSDYNAEADQIAKAYFASDTIVVLDGYHFSTDYQRAIKKGGAILVCVDDLHQVHFVADVVINHASGITSENYTGEYYTRYYLGTEYALLRRPFIAAAKEFRKIETVQSVLICMGGADPNNEVLNIIHKVRTLPGIKKINIVVGASYPHENTLQDFNEDVSIKLYRNISADLLVQVMKESDAAICAASSISYEYCSVGGKLFIIKTFDNQKFLYDFLIKEGLAMSYSLLSDKINEPSEDQITQQRRFFGGQSSKNIQKLFKGFLLQQRISLQRAVSDDCKTFFNWANDPEVRKNSINKNPINWESHVKWFESKLLSKDSILLVGLFDSELIGSLRFDYIENRWSISFSVDEKFRGKGLAEIMLHKALIELRKNIPGQIDLKAQVQLENKASKKIFKNLGFVKDGIEALNDFKYYNFFKQLK
jgi:UDP-2,4-diacetamido-2,4,6-trideoxy-beta-L-altropyranose hydrolase